MKTLTLRKAAKEIGVHHATLARWIRNGEGPKAFTKSGLRSVIRIQQVDLDAFIRRHSRDGR